MTASTVHIGDAVAWANVYDGEPFHALLCDPPYELNFMSKGWDNTGVAFRPETWAAFARVLYPGAFGMAFASSRGWHRLAVAIEDAGLIIHPSIFGWAFGSGFPKATRIDTQVDRDAGAERERRRPILAPARNGDGTAALGGGWQEEPFETEPATDMARAWQGHRYGLQALKPALEPIIVFQKPYPRGVRPVDSIVGTGAGALNIDGARIGTDGGTRKGSQPTRESVGCYGDGINGGGVEPIEGGRWPANFYTDEETARRLDAMSGETTSPSGTSFRHASENLCMAGANTARGISPNGHGDTGGASRFFFCAVADALDEADPVFYTAKAGRSERDRDLEYGEHHVTQAVKWNAGGIGQQELDKGGGFGRNQHPTVKPLSLTKWLATLLLPPVEYAPRRLFVPFAGSGSEMLGAVLAGWEDVHGVEMEAEYAALARTRVAMAMGPLFAGSEAGK